MLSGWFVWAVTHPVGGASEGTLLNQRAFQRIWGKISGQGICSASSALTLLQMTPLLADRKG